MTRPALTLPDPATLAAQLHQALPGFRHIDWVEQTGSTNADLLERARANQPGQLLRPSLLGTHYQQHGRGRSGRTWQNRAGATLMFSCAYDVFLSARHLPALSPLAGLCTAEALRALLEPQNAGQLATKWPNDVLWKQSKLAGILIDVSRAGTALTRDHHIAIIGIGLNLNDARALSQSLHRDVADWAEIASVDTFAAGIGIAHLISGIATAWYDALNTITRSGFDNIPQRYAQVDALHGKAVNIIDRQKIIDTGIACGINTDGQLLLDDGQQKKAVSVGDVSLRAADNPSPHAGSQAKLSP